MTSQTDIAWAAGLFEGEGCAMVTSGGQPRASVEMTDEDVVRRFGQILGVGTIGHYHRGAGRRRETWQWRAGSGADVVAALEMLGPHLGTRRSERAAVVLERAQEIVRDRDLCKRGHDLTDPQHLYVQPKTGKRQCRTCQSENARRWRLRLAG